MRIAFSLESEIKSFFYTAGPFVPSILQSIFEEADDTLVNIPLTLDFFSLIKNYPNIAHALINQYNLFMRSLNQVIFEIAHEEIMRSGSEYLRNKITSMTYHDFNCSIVLKDCLIQQSNIRNVDFIDQASRQKEGKVIYLKNCLVVKVFPPELYLYKWVEKLQDCSCRNLVKNVKKSQSFIDVLSNGVLKERSKQIPEICEFCDRMFEVSETKQEVYLSCQKIKILPLQNHQNSTNPHNYPNNPIQLYLNSNKINKIEPGDSIDVCAYFLTQQRIKAMNQYQKIKIEESNVLVCIEDYLSQPHSHFRFFNSLSHLTIQYTPCNSSDYLKLYNNYKEIVQSINELRFQFSEPKTFTFLKMSLLASLFLWHPYSSPYNEAKESLNIFIITDQETIVQRILRFQHLQYKQFPKVYDPQSVSLFLLGCHNSVLIFTNPTKKEFEYIQSAIRGEIGEGKNRIKVNITVWVIVNPLNKPKEVMTLEMFNVIIDVTFISNVNNRQVHHEISEIVDMLISNYSPAPTFNSGTAKGKRKFRELSETLGRNSKGSKKIETDTVPIIDGLDFLEQYYLTSRQHKKSNVSNLISLKRAAVGISSLRRFLSKQRNPENVDFGDALISIFLDQETSRNKRGNSNTLLANEIAKFMLDQKEQMTINEYVFYQEDFQEVKKTVHKSAVFIRIVDELKRIVRGQSIA